MHFIITRNILDYINSRKQFFEFGDDWPVIGEVWKIKKIVRYPSVNAGEPLIEAYTDEDKEEQRWMKIPADLVFDKEYANEIVDEN